MKLLIFYVIALLPSLILCFLFNWDKDIELSYSPGCMSIPLSNGFTHIFCKQYNSFTHQTLSPQGILSKQKKISNGYTDFIKLMIFTAQSSNDGSHLLFAFRADLENKFPEDKRDQSIYFIESMDGGEKWSEPVLINAGRTERCTEKYICIPKMIYEQDTKRVTIAYTDESTLVIICREPGKKNFETPIYHFLPERRYHLTLGYTINKTDSKRYYHLFWDKSSFITKNLLSTIIYSRSSDNGRTWTKATKIVDRSKVSLYSSIAINTQAVEGNLYAQYIKRSDIKIVWSDDHGEEWKMPLILNGTTYWYNMMSLCGSNGKGILISSALDDEEGNGYIGYARLGENKFRTLPYPRESTKVSLNEYSHLISCAYLGSNRYLITFLKCLYPKEKTKLLRGILIDDA